MGGQPPFMERSVHYDGLGAEAVARLAEQSSTLGMQALVAVNKSAMAAAKRGGKAEAAPRQRMTFGVYFYAEDSAPPPAPPAARASKKRTKDGGAA
jgi:hypothetical protein